MNHLKKPPEAFNRYQAIGGVLKFVIFTNSEGDDVSELAAFKATFPDLNESRLKELGFRELDDRVFYGDWHDHVNDALLMPEAASEPTSRLPFGGVTFKVR